MPAGPITRRDVYCPICEAVIPLGSITSETVGAPELFITTGAPWFGVVVDERTGEPLVVFVCSTDCARKLLEA